MAVRRVEQFLVSRLHRVSHRPGRDVRAGRLQTRRTEDIDNNPTNAHNNVALILERPCGHRPGRLPAFAELGTRQRACPPDDTVGHYGADAATYQVVYNALDTAGTRSLDSTNSYYVTSQDREPSGFSSTRRRSSTALFSSSLQEFNNVPAGPGTILSSGTAISLASEANGNTQGSGVDTSNAPDGMQLTTVDTPACPKVPRASGTARRLTYNFPDGEGRDLRARRRLRISRPSTISRWLERDVATGTIGLTNRLSAATSAAVPMG